MHQAYVIDSEESREPKNRPTVSNNASCKATVQVCGVKVESNKAALSRVVAAKIINLLDGKSRLVYCQLDGGLQITFISDKLVSELGLSPCGNASFSIDTMTGSQRTKADLVELKVESFYNGKSFDLIR